VAVRDCRKPDAAAAAVADFAVADLAPAQRS
jgi:hypothetical protein